MNKLGWLVPLAILGVALAQEPAAAPLAAYRRTLTAADQARVDELRQKVKAAKTLAEQARWQREIADLRAQRQGQDHWEAIDARLEAEHLENAVRIGKLPLEQWRPIMIDRLEIVKLEQEAKQHAAQGQPAKLEAVRRSVLARLRKNAVAKPTDIATAMDELAFLLQEQERYPEAEEAFAEALAFRLKLQGPTHPETARAYLRHALPLFKLGRAKEARGEIEKGWAIHQAARGPESEEALLYLNNLAQVLAEEGAHAAAEVAALDGLALARKLRMDSRPEMAVLLETQALNLLGMGQLAEAEAGLREVLALQAKLQLPALVRAETRSNLAYCLKERAFREPDPTTNPLRFGEAEKLYLEALKFLAAAELADSTASLMIEQNLACLFQTRGNFAEAAARLRKILDRLNGPVLLHAAVVSNLAHCEHELGHFAEAEALVRAALSRAQAEVGDHHPVVVQLRANLAINLASQGFFDEAEKAYQRCADDYETMRVRRGGSGLERSESLRFAPFSALAGLVARRGDAGAAFDLLERGQGRGCLEECTQVVPATDRQRLRHLENLLAEADQRLALAGNRSRRTAKELADMAALRTERDAALTELKRFRGELNRHHGPVGGLGQPWSWQRIQQALPPDTALVGWVDEPGAHWACVLRADGPPQWINLAKDDPLGEWPKEQEELPAELVESVRNVARTDWATLQENLIAARVKPILPYLGAQGRLPAARQIVIFSLGAMQSVPPVLLFSESALAVCLTPSATLYALARQRPPAPRPPRLLALGDVAFAEGSRLPHSRGECLAIAQQMFSQYGAASAVTLLGPDATASRLRQLGGLPKPPTFSFLHLSTHGTAGSARAWDAALQFPRDAAGQTHRITASEVLHSWNLDAELVVLSACNSGMGKQVAGEGFVGFTQALLLAGARGVVVSQWPVSDQATTLLMCRFYENLLGPKKLSKAAALAEAQQWLRGLTGKAARQMLIARAQAAGLKLEEGKLPADSDECIYAHPWYWAGFTLVGAP